MTNHAILTAIENELVRVENHVAQLRAKVHALVEDIPAVAIGSHADNTPTPVLPVDLTTHGASHPRGFRYRGAFQRCHSYIDIYLGLLRAIARDSSDAMPRTAAALQRHGRTRNYLAPDPAHLFQGRTAEWARSHSVRIIDGWYADTNLSLMTMKKLMRRILAANGLHEGSDVVIVWIRRPVEAVFPTSSTAVHERQPH